MNALLIMPVNSGPTPLPIRLMISSITDTVVARERGLRGYSKLRRAELLKLVEEELWGDEPFSVGGVEYVDEPEPEPEPEGKNPFKFW